MGRLCNTGSGGRAGGRDRAPPASGPRESAVARRDHGASVSGPGQHRATERSSTGAGWQVSGQLLVGEWAGFALARNSQGRRIR